MDEKALWNKIDDHAKDIKNHNTRISVLEQTATRHEVKQEEMMRLIYEAQERQKADGASTNALLHKVYGEMSELKGAQKALRWFIPVVITVGLAMASFISYVMQA